VKNKFEKLLQNWSDRIAEEKAQAWESRVRALENEGLTRSDAQAVVDAEDLREKG
jgi:hypothetical protein